MNRLTKMILAGALSWARRWRGPAVPRGRRRPAHAQGPGDPAVRARTGQAREGEARAREAKPAPPARAKAAPPAKKKMPPPAAQPKAPPAATEASADVKAGTGYENHAVTGEAASFPAGTKVYAVSVVHGAKDTTVKHVWKKDGAECGPRRCTSARAGGRPRRCGP